MKVKELINYLSAVDENDELSLDIGGLKTKLLSIDFDADRKEITLGGDNYEMDNNKLTTLSFITYLHKMQKNK